MILLVLFDFFSQKAWCIKVKHLLFKIIKTNCKIPTTELVTDVTHEYQIEYLSDKSIKYRSWGIINPNSVIKLSKALKMINSKRLLDFVISKLFKYHPIKIQINKEIIDMYPTTIWKFILAYACTLISSPKSVSKSNNKISNADNNIESMWYIQTLALKSREDAFPILKIISKLRKKI